MHISGKQGDIAETVLLPGDPVRAKLIAEKYFEKFSKYNEIRGMFGYTGFYKGKKISIQATGMGMPSFAIYATELIKDFCCTKLIRIGSCGSIQEKIKLRDIILAQGASTDSNMNRMVFDGKDFSPIANFGLLRKACDYAQNKGMKFHVGNVLTSDIFYNEVEKFYEIWKKYGVLGIDMETAALYTIAAKYGIEALSILMVSDNILTGESMSSEERASDCDRIVEIALSLI